MVEIIPISTRRELRNFVRFRLDLYKNCPYDVPALYSDEINMLLKGKNPATELYRYQVFVAMRDGKIVGRIVAILNDVANRKAGRDYVRFGFVDFIDDAEVADALVDAVVKWGRENGMTTIHGPLGFTDFDAEGMLVWGFDQTATLAGAYNYPYYHEHIERMGFGKAADWVEFKIPIPDSIPERHLRIAEITKQKYGLRVLKFKNARQIIKQGYGYKLFSLINVTYGDLYGFSSLNDELIDYYVEKYIPLLRIDLVTIVVDANDDIVLFGIAIPSLSKAMQKAHGRLFPFGFIPLLKALKGKAEVCDLMLIAARPDYQNMGIAAILFAELIPQFQKLGTKYAESNPELETNNKVQMLWREFGPVMHKRRRVYEKEIV